MSYQTLLIRKDGPVDWVTLNRPDSLNALNRQLIDDLLEYTQSLYWDKSVRVVVLKGAGRAFCAGLDLKERDNSPRTPTNGLTSQRRISEIVMRMRRSSRSCMDRPAAAALPLRWQVTSASQVRARA